MKRPEQYVLISHISLSSVNELVSYQTGEVCALFTKTNPYITITYLYNIIIFWT